MSSNPADIEFDTLEAIAAAVAAYELNGGYVKTSEYNYNSNQPLPEIAKFPNKELVRAYFGIDHYSVDAPRPTLVKVTDEHRQKAKDIRNYSKKAVFKILGKKPVKDTIFGFDLSLSNGNYEEQLYQILNQDKVKLFNLGFVASAPLYYANGKRRDYTKSRLNEIESQHVGTVGGKVSLHKFEVIRNTKSKNFPGNIIQGICDGNLFLYFASRGAEHIKVGDFIDIDGKVKEHVMEQDTIPMTKLNYVKERINNGNIAETSVVRINCNSDLFRQW